MNRFFLLIIIALFAAHISNAQQDVKGMVMSEGGLPLKFATVSLLNPSDSTLMFFGISNTSGIVEIKKVRNDNYLLQVAMLGYKTIYQPLSVPLEKNDIGVLLMERKGVEMEGVEITAERIPVLINNDTIQYDAGAFKTKADANVEELLKKLPGVEVDRAGNIKAQGENVNKVFVDGKEFFGNDPKVATRNLPADAINKVQVYNKKSDAAEFTGIDDGTRERSINLILKDGKKSGYFGDATAGGGTDSRYKGSAKLYRFRPESQLAVLGMINNINRSGFSFSDYLNFNGGIQGLMAGGNSVRLEMNADEGLPVNFGQPVTGIVTSGAGGINYSYSPGKNKRFAISYLGNGSEKRLTENTYSRNFTDAGDYETEGTGDEVSRNYVHRLNVNIRNDIDSQSQVLFSTNGSTARNKFNSKSSSASRIADVVFNRQTGSDNELGNMFSGTSSMSYVNKGKQGKNVIQLSVNGDYKRNINELDWMNITSFLGQAGGLVADQFRNDNMLTYSYGGSASWTYSLGDGYYVSPAVQYNVDKEQLQRQQGEAPNESTIIDSLSPHYYRSYNNLVPGLTMKRGTKAKQYNVAVKYEHGVLTQSLNGSEVPARSYGYILPSASWRYEYGNSKHIDLSYRTEVVAPGYQQLMNAPVISGPLNVYRGNSSLVPEYRHNASAGWMFYDQFSFTSLFVNLSGTHTINKINRSVTITPDLGQQITMVNVPDDYRAALNINFGRPIRALGIKTGVSFSEQYNRGINIVNGVDNVITGFTHDVSVTIGNRKKEKWDAEIGAGANFTNVQYSVQQGMDNAYFNTRAFSEISYTPNEHWYFALTADITRYDARSFQNAVVVPLLTSEVSYYFLKGNRGVLTVEGFDLLDRNRAVQRISQQNYLADIRSNIIGRYVMLSFKYRITKAGKKNSAAIFDDIDINLK